MDTDGYKHLAEHLNALPGGFPPADNGSELRLLAKLFTPEEAELAAQLAQVPETTEEIAARTGMEISAVRKQLKSMARRGLIQVARKDGNLVFNSAPFIVGFFESQVQTMDSELAHLVEDYFHAGFAQMLLIEPQYHRVVPVHEAVHRSVEVQPYESAAQLIYSMQSWGVQDCVCRKQTALVGKACEHPVDVCLGMDSRPNTFDGIPGWHALTRDEAMATLRRAAEAGLVHTVTNSEQGVTYICNCCKCGCGLLRGMAELGMANVVARSAFVNQVDDGLCTGCEDCLDACQFDALSMDGALARVDRDRCAGCGVCVLRCAVDALVLVRRPAEEVRPVPPTPADWARQRLAARGL